MRQRIKALLVFALLNSLSTLLGAWDLPFRRRNSMNKQQDTTVNPTTAVLSDATPPPTVLPENTIQHQPTVRRALMKVSEANAVLVSWVTKLNHAVSKVILFKPPVGIIGIFVAWRLFKKLTKSPENIEEITDSENRKSRGRKFSLDPDDTRYETHGGVDCVRLQLCLAALPVDSGKTSDTVPSPYSTRLEAARAGLQVMYRPGESRVNFVRELVTSLGTLESSNNSTPHASDKQLQSVLKISEALLQVRALDALLRICRDRLLKAAFRLDRTNRLYTRRLQRSKLWPRPLKFFLLDVNGDQARLSAAKAAYDAEIQRLGEIAHALYQRPPDMDESYLIRALKESEKMVKASKRQKNGRFGSWVLPNISQYSIRWNASGRGRISIRKELDEHIEASTAMELLVSDSSSYNQWIREANDWTRNARTTLCRIVMQTLEGSASTKGFGGPTFESVQQNWCTRQYAKDTNVDDVWKNVLRQVDGLASLRRVGEGKILRLKDAALVHWTRQLDFMGVPSSILILWLAHITHDKLVPYWPAFKKEMTSLYKTAFDIFLERFWAPLKGIYDDLMNKNPTMMSAFGLDIEETSLDHMLRDLGCSDGTPGMRREGLKMATEQYEQALQHQLVGNILKGKLVRLMLIQVQQLKVGVLSALDTIDVLMKGNRIHFQILAAVPAVLIATYGTKLFLRSLYNIRSRDLRPIETVHAEMTALLSEIEKILLLAHQVPAENDSDVKVELQPFELGQLLLAIHRYLILMDYSSPPFPSSHCDQIQLNLQQFLGTDGTLKQCMDVARQVSWLRMIEKKHQELVKYL